MLNHRAATTHTRIAVLFAAGAFGLGLFARSQLLHVISDDYRNFLEHWYRFIDVMGPAASQRYGFANYTPPYIYLLGLAHAILPHAQDLVAIKLVSIAFDVLLAVSGAVLVRKHLPQSVTRPLIAFGILWLMPTVILNSSAWGQVDAAYTSFLVLCIAALSRGKTTMAAMLFGAAFAFKLQALFLLPLVAAMILRGRSPVLDSALIVAVFSAFMLPAVALGRPVHEAYLTYAGQVGTREALAMNAPNLYQWLPAEPQFALGAAGVLLAVAIALYCAGKVLFATHDPAPHSLPLAMTLAIALPFVLPRMHDRYFYPADVLSVLLFVITARTGGVALLVNIGSLCAYYVFFTGQLSILVVVAAVGVLAAMAYCIAVHLVNGPVRASISRDQVGQILARVREHIRRDKFAVAGTVIVTIAVMTGAALIGASEREALRREKRLATFAFEDALAGIDHATAVRCSKAIQLDVVWSGIAQVSRLEPINVLAKGFDAGGRERINADGYVNGRFLFNLLPSAFAERRILAYPDPDQIARVDVGLYIVNGFKHFAATDATGEPLPRNVLGIAVRDAVAGECR